MESPPLFDAKGLHILDPNDHIGKKSNYITLLQKKALLRYFPEGTGQDAVDLGCGFGRITPLLSQRGWRAIGIDPTVQLLDYAKVHFPGPDYRLGGLPNLPVELGSIQLLLVQNVLRPLKMMNKIDLFPGISRYLGEDAKVMIIENIRVGHKDYVQENFIIDLMTREGFLLKRKIPLRAARWWGILLIRYGLLPESTHERIANWELGRMAQKKGTLDGSTGMFYSNLKETACNLQLHKNNPIL